MLRRLRCSITEGQELLSLSCILSLLPYFFLLIGTDQRLAPPHTRVTWVGDEWWVKNMIHSSEIQQDIRSCVSKRHGEKRHHVWTPSRKGKTTFSCDSLKQSPQTVTHLTEKEHTRTVHQTVEFKSESAKSHLCWWLRSVRPLRRRTCLVPHKSH